MYDIGDLEHMKKYGNVSVDGNGQITEFVEKPPQPRTTLAAMCLYYYPRTVLPLMDKYVKEGNNPDQPVASWRGSTNANPFSPTKSTANGSTSAASKRWNGRILEFA